MLRCNDIHLINTEGMNLSTEEKKEIIREKGQWNHAILSRTP